MLAQKHEIKIFSFLSLRFCRKTRKEACCNSSTRCLFSIVEKKCQRSRKHENKRLMVCLWRCNLGDNYFVLGLKNHWLLRMQLSKISTSHLNYAVYSGWGPELKTCHYRWLQWLAMENIRKVNCNRQLKVTVNGYVT